MPEIGILSILSYILLGGIVAIIAIRTGRRKKKKQETPSQNIPNAEQPVAEPDRQTSYTGCYQPKWLLTYHEKQAFREICEVAVPKGYTVFTKVRLLDLIEPRKEYRNNKSIFWKIQAKHVDFVICTENLVAKWIIELQDGSHKSTERMGRDQFVQDVLTACGYKVQMVYGIDKEKLDEFLK